MGLSLISRKIIIFSISLLQMSNREMLAQEIVYYDSIVRVAKLMDQFAEGLRSVHLLPMIRAYPQLFAPLFTYTACISSSDVLDTIYVDEETSILPGDTTILEYLKKWIKEASIEGMSSHNIFLSE